MISIGKHLNKLWRIFGTGFSFTLFGLGAIFLALLLTLFLWPLPLNQEKKQKLTRRCIGRGTAVYVALLKAMGLLTYEFRDLHRLAASGELVVANHPSLLDVVFLLSVLPETNCIVKSSLFKNPITAKVVALAGYIPNSTNGEALIHKATQTLCQGQTLIIFPEGTRTRNFDDLNFKRGAANIALRANCPVRPVIIDCQPKTLRKNEKWYQVPASTPHFTLSVLELLDIQEAVDTSRPQAIQARHLTRYMHDVMVEHLPCQ